MEQEYFLTGYCRTIDQSRTVMIVTEDGKLIEADCLYKNCIHAPNCTIAQEIEKKAKERSPL